jgi:sporulation protein YlmC with PRC-barrel domain
MTTTRVEKQEGFFMNARFRKTLIAAAIAALMSAPVWAQEEMRGAPGGAPEAETGQPMDAAPPAGDQGDRYLAPQNTGSNNPLYTMTPNDLRRGEVVDATGEKVGNIKTIVLDPNRESIHAVISSGGILGFGAKEIVVSFDELQLADDKVQATATKQELEGRAEYVSEEYVELEADKPISEFSAFEPAPAPGGEPGNMPSDEPGSMQDEQPGSSVVPEPPL